MSATVKTTKDHVQRLPGQSSAKPFRFDRRMLSRAQFPVLLVLLSLTACRERQEQRATGAVEISTSSTVTLESPVAAKNAAIADPSSRLDEAATEQTKPRQPVVLDEAGRQKATAYLRALGGGRKATSAKDYVKAEEQFSSCLKLIPDDARALSERGYARQLAGDLVGAEADLFAAEQRAPKGVLLQQILHNRMTVAHKLGDAEGAAKYGDAEKQLKASRRIGPGVDCSFDAVAVSTQPERLKTMAEVWATIRDVHRKEVAAKEPDAPVTLGNEPVPANATEAELWQRMTGGPNRNGGWVITTKSSDSEVVGQSVLFSKDGSLFLHPKVAFSYPGLCQSTDKTVTVGGGGAVPWHIGITSSAVDMVPLCEWPGRKLTPCGVPEGGRPTEQSACTWTESTQKLLICDAESFEQRISITVVVESQMKETSREPKHLLDVEYLSDQVLVDVCGSRRTVPYDLGTDAPSSTVEKP